MSETLYDKKKRFENAAFEAYQKKDFEAAYQATRQAIQVTMELRENSCGPMYDAYEKDLLSLVTLAESLKEKIKSPQKACSGNGTPVDSKSNSKFSPTERPATRLDDVAGMDDVKNLIRLRMIEPVKRPEEAKKHGLKLGGGILLYGPPGTGKTFIAKAIAGELDLPFYSISVADILDKYVGESPKNIKAIFEEARKNPLSVLFIDEMESLTAKRGGNSHETTHQVVTVLLQQLDGIDSGTKNPILVIGATNCPGDIDPAFLREGRLGEQIYVGYPDREARKKIIQNAFKNVKYPVDEEAINYLADNTENFSGANLTGLVYKIQEKAFDKKMTHYPKDFIIEVRNEVTPSFDAESVNRILEWEKSRGIIRDKKKIVDPAPESAPDIQKTVPEQKNQQVKTPAPEQPKPQVKAPVPPAPQPPPRKPESAKKGITLADVKGLNEAKEIVYDSLINPVLYPDVYRTLGAIPGTGLLLYGPPGTGKTMFARAIANELNTDFISATLSDVKGKTSLQTVQMISGLFTKARSCPRGCVLCLDDCEEILSRPGGTKAYGVSQFLNELDGLKKTDGKGKVFVLIATNRPWMIDGALLRSGRISASVYVGLPEKESRLEIIRTALNGVLLAEDVDVERLAEITDGYSCAELYHGEKGGGICNLAKTYASRRWVARIKEDPREKAIVEPLCWKDFEDAMASVTPSAVKDAVRIAEIEKFRRNHSFRKPADDSVEDIGENTFEEPVEISAEEISIPDMAALKDLVFQSSVIRNTPDYKHFADNVYFLYNDKFSDKNQFNAYATITNGIVEKYGLKGAELEDAPDRPAIIINEGLVLASFAFAAYYQKTNPSLALENPEALKEFLYDLNGIFCRNDSNFTMEHLKELNEKYCLFSNRENFEKIKLLTYAITAIAIAHELGHIVYGDIFKIGAGSVYERNMERSADQFAVDVIKGIEDPGIREFLIVGAALSFITEAALGNVDRDIPVDSEISHPNTLERYQILVESTRESIERYNLSEENFLKCIP